MKDELVNKKKLKLLKVAVLFQGLISLFNAIYCMDHSMNQRILQ